MKKELFEKVGAMLEEMKVDELEELKRMVEEEIRRRKEVEKKEFEFEFKCVAKRKRHPYVARLEWNDGKLERKFFDMLREYDSKNVTVSGKYTAKAGDIIEKREGGSWKNEYRYWYLITESGNEVMVADYDSSKEKERVIRYLMGEISAKELLQ